MGKLIVIEGADAVGKETQSKLLVNRLRPKGFRAGDFAALVEVPTQGITHGIIYWALKNGIAKRFPNVFQFVQFMNKFLFQRFELPKLMKSYDYVILDRWSLSSIVYGDATGVNRWFNMHMHSLLVRPDITIVIHGTSFLRNKANDTYETDSKLQRDVKAGYVDWANNHPEDHMLISNDGTVEQVHDAIMLTLADEKIIRWDPIDASNNVYNSLTGEFTRVK